MDSSSLLVLLYVKNSSFIFILKCNRIMVENVSANTCRSKRMLAVSWFCHLEKASIFPLKCLLFLSSMKYESIRNVATSFSKFAELLF